MNNFENAIKEIKNKLIKIKGILALIVYGSVARGDYSERHSDLDLFAVIEKEDAELQEKSREIAFKTGIKNKVNVHLEFQPLMIKQEDRTLILKMAEEGKVIFSKGLLIIGSAMLGLKAYNLLTFSTKNTGKNERVLLSRALHGAKSWYYKNGKRIESSYKGIIDNDNIIEAGRGSLIIKKEKLEDVEILLKRYCVEYTMKRIFYG